MYYCTKNSPLRKQKPQGPNHILSTIMRTNNGYCLTYKDRSITYPSNKLGLKMTKKYNTIDILIQIENI